MPGDVPPPGGLGPICLGGGSRQAVIRVLYNNVNDLREIDRLTLSVKPRFTG
jgi:hypothetical protein